MTPEPRALRIVFVGVVFMTLVMGVVVLMVTGEEVEPTIATSTGVQVVVVACGITLLGTFLARAHRLPVLLRLAVAELAALVGFVVALLANEPLLYGIGAVCALIGYARAAVRLSPGR